MAYAERVEPERTLPSSQETPARLRWPGVLTGIGLAGTLDEVVLHQLLHWHHLYDRSTQAIGLVSDGIFHIISTLALGFGIAGAWRLRGAPQPVWRAFFGWVLVAAGAFNMYDATVQHKLLRLHQVRPDASNWLPYDLTFGGIAFLTLIAGLLLLRTAGPRAR